MAQEIERKFLVKGEFKSLITQEFDIIQGYLSTVPERTVRVRIIDSKAFLTIKGKTNSTGISRYEWEKEISVAEAKDLLKICEPGVIDKTRYIVLAENNLKFEIDEFYGDNKGLTVAEIELPSENTFFKKPEWLGIEVTGELKYYNSNLMKKPYKYW